MAETVVNTPDGKTLTVVHPEGASEDQILNYAKSQYGRIQASIADESAPVVNDPANTPVVGNFDNFLAGIGSGMSDIGLGVQQLANRIAPNVGVPLSPGAQRVEIDREPFDRRRDELREQVRTKREIDAPLDDTKAGLGGKITGNIALGLPTLAVPGANTVTGAAVTGSLLGAAQPVESDQERLLNTVTGGVFGAGGQKLGDLAGRGINKVLAKRSADKLSRDSARQPLDELIRQSTDRGLVVPPTTANPSTLNRLLEGASGKISTAQGASVLNQGVFKKIASESLDLPPDVPLSKATLQGLRKRLGTVYEDIKNSGKVVTDDRFLGDIQNIQNASRQITDQFPGMPVSGGDDVAKMIKGLSVREFSSDAGVELVKRLRRESKTLFKSFDDPAKFAQAVAKRKAADALDDQILRNLERTGRGDLAKKFRPAREMIAKSHTIEAALDEGGTINAKILARQLNSGTPMSGDLELAARFADTFGKASQATNESFPLFSPLDVVSGVGLGAIDPILSTTAVARPLIRRGILSGPAQNSLLTPSLLGDKTTVGGLTALELLARRGGLLGAAGSVQAVQ